MDHVSAGSLLGEAQWLAMSSSPRAGVLWVGASAVGLGLGMTPGVVLVEALGRAITGEQARLFTIGPLGRALGLALAGSVAGLAVGAAQWLALLTLAAASARWALWCAVGFGVGLPSGALAAAMGCPAVLRALVASPPSWESRA